MVSNAVSATNQMRGKADSTLMSILNEKPFGKPGSTTNINTVNLGSVLKAEVTDIDTRRTKDNHPTSLVSESKSNFIKEESNKVNTQANTALDLTKVSSCNKVKKEIERNSM